MDVVAGAAQIMTEQEARDAKDKRMAKVKDLAIASGAPALGGGAVNIVLRALGNLSAKSSVDRGLNRSLRDYAERKGIEVRKGRESMAESYIYPMKVHRIIERAVQRKIPIHMDTPEGPIPIQNLLGKKVVWLQKGKDTNPAQFAHEIGHLPDKPRHPDWNHVTITIPKIVAPAAALGTAVIGGARAKTPEGAERAGQVGALVGLLGSLPMLLSEASASAKGLKLMRQRGAARGQITRLGLTRMAPHFGTYMTMAAVPALASVLIGKAIAKHKREKEK